MSYLFHHNIELTHLIAYLLSVSILQVLDILIAIKGVVHLKVSSVLGFSLLDSLMESLLSLISNSSFSFAYVFIDRITQSHIHGS
jgi:hypothetical protein